MIRKIIAWFRIPRGQYCYRIIFHKKKKREFKICPYWDLRTDKHYQDNGYCHYLKRGDWEVKYCSLLWDQVKECGIKE